MDPVYRTQSTSGDVASPSGVARWRATPYCLDARQAPRVARIVGSGGMLQILSTNNLHLTTHLRPSDPDLLEGITQTLDTRNNVATSTGAPSRFRNRFRIGAAK